MKNQHVYTVEILGTGAAFEAAHATLDTLPYLPLPGASYLVAGEAARDALRAHHGAEGVAVAASLTTPGEADEVQAPASVIAAFIGHVGRAMDLAFRWDDEAHLWCLSSNLDGNYHESDDCPADSEEAAARAALEYVLLDQENDVIAAELPREAVGA